MSGFSRSTGVLCLLAAALATASPARAAAQIPQSTPTAGVLSCANSALVPGDAGRATVETAIVCLVNAQRVLGGRAALRPSRGLHAAARDYGRSMVSLGFWGHEDPSGATLDDRLRSHHYLGRGFAHWQDAENLAEAGGSLASAEHIVAQWMASAPHRANLMRASLRDIGVAITPGAPADVGANPFTVVMDLGERH